MKILGLFPGQGSQAVGMGKAFFETGGRAKELFEEADSALGYSLSRLCLDGPLEQLTLTENAQPAILLVSTIAFELAGIELSAAAGHSLGEYTALVAAGSLTLGGAIRLVNRRGKYMQEAVPAGAGRMSAVMGPTPEEIRETISEVTAGVCEVANLNSPGQTVVAGDAAGVEEFQKLMTAKGAKVIPLNVSAPFHCRLMKPAAEKLAVDLDSAKIRDPKFPIYANVTAEPVTTAVEVRRLLKEQVCGSVRWTESMQNVIRNESITRSVEFGAGGVLTKLLKRIEPSVERFEVADPASLEKTRQALAS